MPPLAVIGCSPYNGCIAEGSAEGSANDTTANAPAFNMSLRLQSGHDLVVGVITHSQVSETVCQDNAVAALGISDRPLGTIRERSGNRTKGEFGQLQEKSQLSKVLLSKAFLAGKKWTDHEFSTLFELEEPGKKLVLPIWHGISREDLLKYSPSLAGRLAKISTNDSYQNIAESLLKMLGRPARAQTAAPVSAPAAVTAPKGEVVGYAWYEDSGGQRVQLYVRKSVAASDRFTKQADGRGNSGATNKRIRVQGCTVKDVHDDSRTD